MRNALLKSTALAAMLITSSFAYAQSPEPQSDKNGPAATHQGTAQEQKRDAHPEPKGAAQQTAPKQEPGHAQHDVQPSHNAAQEKASPATSGQNANQPKQAEEQRKNAAEERKNAQEQRKNNAEEQRKNAQEQRKNEDARKHAAEQDKSKSQEQKAGTQTPAQQQQKGAATQPPASQQQQGATQTPAQQQKTTTQAPTQTQQPAAAQSNAPASNTTTTQQTTTQQNANLTSNANQLAPQKRVQISETFTRTQVAPPERNLRSLNVSINVGTVVPSRVRFYRLPREVWAIEPQYRDYDYFTTEEDIVIVEPRSHRIVSLVPRNPQRARAEVTQLSQQAGSLGSAQAGPPPCQIMKRDQNGQLTEVRPGDLEPSTVGSGGQGPALSVMVQAGGGQGTQPILLDAPGQIVVASQGNGDCQITIEPLQR
jgi:uncharacterized protein DUF1236